MVASRFLLKTAPPRPGRALPVRPRLEQRWSQINDRTAILVTAPQGFGKTTLLAQWRRRWLERGALVAWMTLDAQDERAQFVELAGFALRGATGRDSFAIATMQGRLQEGRELDALTALLAETAALATPTVMVIDDAHRMPQVALATMLSYLLNNAPPNLQVVIGTRRPLDLALADLMGSGQLASVGVEDLRLDPEESREAIRSRFGSRISLDAATHLHDLTEGWPLGLQLAMTAIERAGDPQAMIRELSARRGDIQRFFFETMLSRLAPEEAAFWVRASILESMNDELAAAVTGYAGAGPLLEAAVRESPVMSLAELAGWMRLHAMARDFLLGQFDRLPVDERRACYERASAWYAARGQPQEAARHAWAAGNEALAVAHAQQCLRDIAAEGRLSEARDWIRRIPASSMARDVGLQINAAWVQALGDAPQEVPAILQRLRHGAVLDEQQRFEVALTEAAATVFSDKGGLIAGTLAEWQVPPPSATPLHVVALMNPLAIQALHSGDPVRARELLCPCIASTDRGPSMRLALGFSEAVVAMSHIWESNPARTLARLQPALAAEEREMGRRSVVAALYASVLSGARFLMGDFAAAQSLLAGRLDVIERTGLPDTIVLAYRVLSEGAILRGEDARALEALQALQELGHARDLPRVVLASHVGQVALHVRQSRLGTAAGCLAAAEALSPLFDRLEYSLFRRQMSRRLAIAAAQLHLALGDAAAAAAVLEPAAISEATGRSPDLLTARALRAVALNRLARPGARDILAETLSLAELGGMRWYVEAAHPDIAGMIGGELPGAAATTSTDTSAALARESSPPNGGAATSGLLTPKEARILALLGSGMANKEIARAMDIGEQTVKWHLKNVFFKLNAVSRRHAVDRARLLGLLKA